MTLASLRSIMEKCARCGTCRASCPSLEANDEGRPGWETRGPRGRMGLAAGLLEGKVAPTAELRDAMFTCFFCNHCVVSCPSLADISKVIIGARRHLAAAGCISPRVESAQETVKDSKNLFGMDQEERVELWAMDVEDLVEGKVNVPADVLYFVGCQASYKGDLAPVPSSMVRILDALGESFTILGENEACCGNPLELTGAPGENVAALAAENLAAIEALGVKEVIFTCPGCYRMFTVVYPELLGKPLPFSTSMASEYLLRKVKENGIELGPLPGDGRIVYHDPCELGRHIGMYDPPRDLLMAIPGVDLVEFKANRDQCACCGMGGGVAMHDPAVSGFQARRKAGDIAACGASTVVTHCPACFQGITAAAALAPDGCTPAGVVDIVQLVARAMGLDG